MRNDDDFDFDQVPDFMSSFPDLKTTVFSERDTADEDGLIECPFLPLRDVVLFPQMVMPLFVGRDLSLGALRAATENDENLIVAAQLDPDVLEPALVDIFPLGTEISIGRTLRLPDDTVSVLAQGRRRVEVLEFTQTEPYIRARARVIPEAAEWNDTTEALMRAVLALFEKVVRSQSQHSRRCLHFRHEHE